jgi:hypothetical protein
MAYYDMDKQRTRTRLFNKVEIAAANEVFRTLEDILLDHDYDVKGKWISSGKCGYGSHQDTYFVVEIGDDVLELNVIHEIEEALEDRDVELAYVMAGDKDSIQLAIIQKHMSEKSEPSGS